MIVLINPNSTVSMTEAMVQTVRADRPGLVVEGWTSALGPAAIQGAEDGDLAVPPMLDLVQQASDKGARAIIIGCFDDTGLDAAQSIAKCPVIGIGQAAYHVASMTSTRFSVVTTLAVSVPILEANVKAYGLAPHLARVRASGVPVLELEQNPEAAMQAVLDEILQAEAEDDIGAVVLGCGGMVHLPELVREHTELRLIDGVRAAIAVADLF
ncbi:MAG: aspartate/glutamate racemase family protein [Marinosulfonomonas sp.]